MKKNYIQPNCKLHEAHLQTMIAVSFDGEVNNTPVNGVSGDAKDFSFEEWDFDWDE